MTQKPRSKSKPSRRPPSTVVDKSLTPEAKALLDDAIKLFNKKKYWEAHEVFEEVWRSTEGELKVCVQGLVQSAAAFSYIQLRRYQSAIYLLDKSIEKLESTKHLLSRWGLGVLIRAMQKAKHVATALGPDRLDQFDEKLFPRLKGTKRKTRWG